MKKWADDREWALLVLILLLGVLVLFLLSQRSVQPMIWVLIANTGYNPIADYYTLGITLVALIIIIVALRGIIRGGPREKEADSQ